MTQLSIIIPAHNEAASLKKLLPELIAMYPLAEKIVVNDGSNDDTQQLLETLDVIVVTHPYQMGNGSAIKSGARRATGEALLFLDADGQHQVKDIDKLISEYQQGYDMVVGARHKSAQASFARWIGNSVYNALASFVVNHPILDLTSGFRIVNAKKFKSFIYLLPNGFSSPSTITLAFFRQGYSCAYVPIDVKQREGKSHINLMKDGFRFFLIIYKMVVFYSPLKVFVPVSGIFLMLGLINYTYTFFDSGRFTNMSALFMTISVMLILLGFISEQITNLLYAQQNHNDE